jgi:hypothetical protein
LEERGEALVLGGLVIFALPGRTGNDKETDMVAFHRLADARGVSGNGKRHDAATREPVEHRELASHDDATGRRLQPLGGFANMTEWPLGGVCPEVVGGSGCLKTESGEDYEGCRHGTAA